MTERILTRQQARLIDRYALEQYGMSGLVLMENAGRGCIEPMIEHGIDGPVAICCGKGNNAGDGFVMARHLDARGKQCKVLLSGDPGQLSSDALENYRILTKTDVTILELGARSDDDRFVAELDSADWIVDALLGTGSQGQPRPPFDRIIEQLNDHSAKKLAIDLPSGLDCDSGQPAESTFRADYTCTFVAPKPGLLVPAARPFVGQIYVVDIGIPPGLIEQVLAGQES